MNKNLLAFILALLALLVPCFAEDSAGSSTGTVSSTGSFQFQAYKESTAPSDEDMILNITVTEYVSKSAGSKVSNTQRADYRIPSTDNDSKAISLFDVKLKTNTLRAVSLSIEVGDFEASDGSAPLGADFAFSHSESNANYYDSNEKFGSGGGGLLLLPLRPRKRLDGVDFNKWRDIDEDCRGLQKTIPVGVI